MDILADLFSENRLATYIAGVFFIVIAAVTILSSTRQPKAGESEFADTYDAEIEKIRKKKKD